MDITPQLPLMTLSAASDAIATWRDLTPSRRSQLNAALRALGRLQAGRQYTAALDPEGSIATLERATAAQLGVAAGTLGNYTSSLRYILRRLGMLTSSSPVGRSITDPAWRDLLDRLPASLEFARLRSFVAHCDEQHIAPHAVTQDTLARYVEQRIAHRGGGRQNDHGRRVANLWRRAAREIAAWPDQILLPTRQLTRSRPLSLYGAPLVAEVDGYALRLTGGDQINLFDERSVRPRAAATVVTRLSCIRRLLHGAAEAGIPLERLSHLAVLTERDVFRAAIGWHLKRAGDKTNADIEQLAVTVISVAQILGVDEPVLKALKADTRRLKAPVSNAIAPRNAAILDSLDDPMRRAKLLHLPARLMREATRLRDGWTDTAGVAHAPRRHEAAWLAGIAVAVEIELHLPLRMLNLQRLRLGQEVVALPESRQRKIFVIRVDGAQVKNRQGVEATLTGPSAILMEDYLANFRALLPHAGGIWLFPGALGTEAPRDKVSFGRAITDVIHRHVGITMHPHAFRAFAAALILEADPHAIDDLRALLGHAGFETATKFYRRAKARDAAGRLAAGVGRQRNLSAALAKVSPRDRSRRLDMTAAPSRPYGTGRMAGGPR